MPNIEKETLCRRLKMHDRGKADCLLGMLIKQRRTESEKRRLCRATCTEKLLGRLGMESCKPVGTPFDVVRNFMNYLMMMKVLILKHISKLLYVRRTRP